MIPKVEDGKRMPVCLKKRVRDCQTEREKEIRGQGMKKERTYPQSQQNLK